MQTSARPSQSVPPGAIATAPFSMAFSLGASQPVQTPIGPHRPQVPMPELIGAPFISRRNRQVAMGPVIALARIGGIHIRGFRTMFGICSILVPRPWETIPPQRFSRKLMTAKPTICAQQPATAAPPASPVRPSTEQIAAEEIGSVSATPTSTDTAMPIQKG